MFDKAMTRSGVFLVAAALSMSAYARADNGKHPINIPSGDLGTALELLGKQSGSDLVYRPEQVQGLRTGGIAGELSTQDAAKQLIRGTPLTVSQDVTGAVLIAAPLRIEKQQATGSPTAETVKEGKSDSSGGFRLARADQGAAAQAAPVGSDTSVGAPYEAPRIEEIVVTAQKRSESLLDVPVPVSVVNTSDLVNMDQSRLQDYYSSIPGLNVVPSGSFQYLTIRGITTGPGNPTVGITVDDMPFGASSGTGGGQIVPDVDPGDLARVEVLRGPQGTLYGASSMGGLIKFVTVDPSTEAVSGRLEAGTSTVFNGSKLEYNVRGSANLPLGNDAAIRASAFTREDPGYIDNPVAHTDGVNAERTSGGRLSALWRPLDVFSVKVNALYQETRGFGAADVSAQPGTTEPALGDLRQNFLLGTGQYTRKVQAYTAVLTGKAGVVDLTSITGYNVNEFSQSDDFPAYSPYTQDFFQVAGAALVSHNKTDKLTQEIRASLPIGQKLDWLIGAFYTHEKSPYVQNVLAIDPTSGIAAGNVVTLSFPTTYKEYAGFTDLTLHLGDKLDVQLGARESRIEQAYVQSYAPGPLLPTGLEGPQLNSSNSAFTYLLTPQFKFSPDLMLYARLASGYRAGGPNTTPGPGIPSQYGPDKTLNYELGVKGDFLEHRLSVDASAYYIDWKDIQLNVKDPTTGIYYYLNGSRAKSQGIEISSEMRPLTGLSLRAWVVWNQAVLTQAFPPSSTDAGVYGADGDRLPFSSRFTGNLSAEQEYPFTDHLSAYVGGAISYVGNRENTFTATSSRQIFPAYARTDLHTGIRYAAWMINLFANNVADRRGVLETDLNTGGIYYIQPRTVGLTVSRSF